jgi:cold shock CspA family protein
MDERVTGVIDRVCSGPGQGYAFARLDETGDMVFFHKNDVWFFNQLQPGDVLEFAVIRTERGLRAQDVELVEQSSSDRVRGRLIMHAGTYGFVTVPGHGEAFVSGTGFDGDFGALARGAIITGRLVKQGGRERMRLIEARLDNEE